MLFCIFVVKMITAESIYNDSGGSVLVDGHICVLSSVYSFSY